VAQELTEEKPTKFVRVLAENLVLFRDKKGRVGLLDDRCSHRGASLCYGRVEERGIACAYHGWLYDVQGNCLETPPEPAESKFTLTVKHKAYPVQKFIGLYWAYLGPEPAPLIPQYDVYARKDGRRKLFVQPQLDCNWFQAMENSVDPAHLQILHQETALDAGRRKPVNTTRGFTDDVESFDFFEVPMGILKKRKYKNGVVDEHPVMFPNVLRQFNGAQIRVPIDDTHTMIFIVRFLPTEDGSLVENDEPPVEYVKPYKNPPDAIHPDTRFRLNEVQAQDHMAWETQGPIADRTRERLATSDRGVVMLREMMKREIARVQQGLDPKGVIRDPADNGMIDTHLMESIREMNQWRQGRELPAALRVGA
ncbi:MAG: hypothetical protein A3F90_01560, partial [Deltaproteobacteria bacterium RIFCSPLOWO2_12_FULL_60_19]